MAQYLDVEYIYEEWHTIAPSILDTASSAEVLTPQTIAFMPDEWIKKLHQAATRLNNKEIKQLIQQIPEDKAYLQTSLEDLVNKIRFDTIVQLSQPNVENE